MRTAAPPLRVGFAKASTAVNVGVGSTPVVANNDARSELTVVNDGANVVYLALATVVASDVPQAPTAVANSGIRLAAGGSWTSNAYTGPVAGIAPAGATNCTVAEI